MPSVFLPLETKRKEDGRKDDYDFWAKNGEIKFSSFLSTDQRQTRQLNKMTLHHDKTVRKDLKFYTEWSNEIHNKC